MGSNNLKIQYYKVILLSIKRSSKGGIVVNAKPILVLSFFDLIAQGLIRENKFAFDKNLTSIYSKTCNHYEPDKKITSCVYPFYHIRNDGFVNLSFKDLSTKLPHTPSSKFLRENVKYASLDNALWDLLQDTEARNILREAIINNFLNPKANKS